MRYLLMLALLLAALSPCSASEADEQPTVASTQGLVGGPGAVIVTLYPGEYYTNLIRFQAKKPAVITGFALTLGVPQPFDVAVLQLVGNKKNLRWQLIDAISGAILPLVTFVPKKTDDYQVVIYNPNPYPITILGRTN